jgi:hypothetical protein
MAAAGRVSAALLLGGRDERVSHSLNSLWASVCTNHRLHRPHEVRKTVPLHLRRTKEYAAPKTCLIFA